MTEESREIIKCIQQMHFRKKFFGGVDEMDVWRQLEALQIEYEKQMMKQKIRSDAVLKEREERIRHLEAILISGKDISSELHKEENKRKTKEEKWAYRGNAAN